MFRRALGLGLMVALAGCTDRVLLRDVWDAGVPSPDASLPEAPSPEPDSREAAPIVDAECNKNPQYLTFWSRGAQVIVLLDHSSTMQGSFSGSTSRAAAAQSALTAAIEAYQYNIWFGFDRFPDPDNRIGSCRNATACCTGGIIPPTYAALRNLKSKGVLTCTDPLGCVAASSDSPSHLALAEARDYFKHEQSDNPNQWDSEQYVVLIAGNEPSCSAEGSRGDACNAANRAVADLANLSNGVPVVVLAIGYQPSTTDNSCLAGLTVVEIKGGIRAGVERLYQTSTFSELERKLTDLFAAIAKSGCTFSTRDPIPAGVTLTVTLPGLSRPPYVPVPRAQNCSASDGWCFSIPGRRDQITLLGQYCDQYLKGQQSIGQSTYGPSYGGPGSSDDIFVSYTSCGP
jgi:hypothetical protein